MEQLEGDYIWVGGGGGTCFYRSNTFTTTNRQSRTLWMLVWKGSRKSCHVLGQWLLVILQLRLLWENGQRPVPFCLSPSVAAFCSEPVSFHSPNPLGMSPPIPYQEATRSSFCCHWVFGSSISPEAEFMLLFDLAEVPGPKAAPHPDRALASPKKSCPPTRESCKNRGLWRTHVKTAQQKVKGWENRAGIPLTAVSPLLWSFTAPPLFLPTL